MPRQDDTIFLLGDDGQIEKVPRVPYDSEELLQKLIEDHPNILAGDQIYLDEPVRWLLVSREVGIPDSENSSDRWALDHLLLDQRARPTFVEVKRSTDSRIRREVVGQMLDYAANAQMYWPVDRVRSLAAEQHGGVEELDTVILSLLGGEEGDQEAVEGYWADVENNLRSGVVRLLFVADEIPHELRRLIEFLNEQMPRVEVLGVEICQYVGSNLRAFVPRVVGQTEATRQSKQHSLNSKKTDRKTFLEACPPEVRLIYGEILSDAPRRGQFISWGKKGFTVRVRCLDGRLLTVLYCYPPGASERGIAHVQTYLGYIKCEGLRDQVRKAFLNAGPFEERGKYTLHLDLIADRLDDVRKVVSVLWDVAKLTRISHQLSAAAADMALPASLRFIGLLDVSQRIRLRGPQSQASQPEPSRRFRYESR